MRVMIQRTVLLFMRTSLGHIIYNIVGNKETDIQNTYTRAQAHKQHGTPDLLNTELDRINWH